jgi:predicted ATPase
MNRHIINRSLIKKIKQYMAHCMFYREFGILDLTGKDFEEPIITLRMNLKNAHSWFLSIDLPFQVKYTYEGFAFNSSGNLKSTQSLLNTYTVTRCCLGGEHVRSGIHLNANSFGDSVQEFVRTSGYSQKELAEAIGLHPKVLSRKLNGSGKAHLTHLEVQRIITTLARWHAITSQDEAFHLLELAQIEPNSFGAEEWQKPPLSQLVVKRTQSVPFNGFHTAMRPMRHNLPAPTTRLIGREWAVERLLEVLGRDEVRLLTLFGSGGSGKTRLALQVASEMVDMFAQGVWFVPLAGVSDAAQVPMSIIHALNIKPTPGLSLIQSLTKYLRNKHLLLVLDNFEHVEEAATIVDEMLTAAPDLKVLVTSRAVLHLYGEYEFSVPPLDVPDPGIELKAAELSQYSAMQLFVERAKLVVPDFSLTAENANSIAQICARVDGLPLALELAAARVKVLPPALLLKRLSEARLDTLAGGARNLPSRQQTLRNTITWSYNLLSPTEQAWFPRLGVFSGGWSLEAAEAMMQSVEEEQKDTPAYDFVLEKLMLLVDNSLLVRLPVVGEQVRFTMLETLREYALEQLSEQEELERLRDWHAWYYMQIAEVAELGLRGPQQLVWLARLKADRDNFRAALEWSLQQARSGMRISAFAAQGLIEECTGVTDSSTLSSKAVPGAGLLAVELCLRLAAALRPYWEWQGYLVEARSWLGATLKLPLAEEAGEMVLAGLAKALSEYSRLASLENDQTRAAALVEESIALWQRLDDPKGLAAALIHRAWAALAMSEYETARRACLEGLQYLTTTDDPWLRAQLLFYLGAAAGFTGDFEQMRDFYTQSRELFELVGDTSSVADVLKDHGAMMILESKYAESIDYLLKSIQLCYKLDHKQFITTGMCWLSISVGMRGEPDLIVASIHAAQLEGAAEGLREAIGFTSWAETNPLVQAVQQYIRSRVDEESWKAAWAEGRALTVEQAIDLACRLA